jgi:hypothetical protein
MVHETWVINASKAYWILKFFKGLSNSLTLLPTRRAAVPPITQNRSQLAIPNGNKKGHVSGRVEVKLLEAEPCSGT